MKRLSIFISDLCFFKQIRQNNLDINLKNYYIKIIINSKLSIIKDILESFKDDKYKNKQIILILEKKPNKSIMKLIDTNIIQVFCYNELIIDKSSHILVPKHTLVEKEEHNEIMEKFKLQRKNQLPLIYSCDPMAKYINAKKGDIIKIKRVSKSSGVHIIYRYVIDKNI